MSQATAERKSLRLRIAERVLNEESAALRLVASRLGEPFVRLLDFFTQTRGRLVVTGLGKSADVGRKIVATLNSTGTRSLFLDPAAALHGDLGAVCSDDALLFLSHSGESVELLRLLDAVGFLSVGTSAITNKADSTLARRVDIAYTYGPIQEADPLGLAPSSSTTVMMALGDAIAFTLAHERGFTQRDFFRFHPAGSLGTRLTPVSSVMRRGSELRLAPVEATIREVLVAASRPGRRSGAILLVDAEGRLRGLFTDSDLVRMIEEGADVATCPIREAMTVNPITIPSDSTLADAFTILSRHKISELPVVDAAGCPVGLIDVTDLIALPGGFASLPRHAA